MSILSDAEIKKLCILPDDATYFDEERYQSLIKEQDQRGWPLTDYSREGILTDLRQSCTRAYSTGEREAFKPMIEPYCESLVREVYGLVTKPVGGSIEAGFQMATIATNPRKVLSYGQSSYGYDVTLADTISIFSDINSVIIDPKQFDARCLIGAEVRSDHTGQYVVLPPNSYLLGHTVEYFRMPRDVTAIFLAKSTYARAGVSVNATPAEAGWDGVLVLEVANQTSLPVKIYVNEGIAQALFFRGNHPCTTSYADRGGKYMGQTGITLPKV